MACRSSTTSSTRKAPRVAASPETAPSIPTPDLEQQAPAGLQSRRRLRDEPLIDVEARIPPRTGPRAVRDRGPPRQRSPRRAAKRRAGCSARGRTTGRAGKLSRRSPPRRPTRPATPCRTAFRAPPRELPPRCRPPSRGPRAPRARHETAMQPDPVPTSAKTTGPGATLWDSFALFLPGFPSRGAGSARRGRPRNPGRRIPVCR